MELSPKQQSVEQIKKANRILIIGHKNPSGDFLGSALALQKALTEIGKSVEVAITDEIPQTFKFLPFIKNIKNNFSQNTGKILRINTQKLPVKSVKFQKDEGTLDFILESDKNVKFEYIEIINGEPKPDLIIVLNTSDVEKIDSIYDKNTELFFEVPVINIDHHAGNEYFGTVNLVDLTATSTAEILVALLEALGIKISDADSATLLLAGIISETGSFRSQNTTPKSLTVAAQLLAGGGRQQEIVNNLYRKRPMALMKIWGEMLADVQLDANHQFAWTKVKLPEDSAVTVNDVMDAADELLSGNPGTEMILILVQKGTGPICGKFKSKTGHDVLPLAELFEGDGVPTNATFELTDMRLGDAELTVLKTLADFWGEGNTSDKDVWDVIDHEKTKEIEAEMVKQPEISEETEAEIEKEMTEAPKKEQDADIIDSALHSIKKEEEKVSKKTTKKGPGSFSSVGEVLYKKTANFEIPIKYEKKKDAKEIDVFDEENE
jgi:bifunctional oligoribonuclease and PAP phosphatase NrnA